MKIKINVLIFSDNRDEINNISKELSNDNYIISKTTCIDIFKEAFYKSEFIIIDCIDIDILKEIKIFINENKQQQYIVIFMNKNNPLLNSIVESRINEIIFAPHDFTRIKDKLFKFHNTLDTNNTLLLIDKKNTLNSLLKIKEDINMNNKNLLISFNKKYKVILQQNKELITNKIQYILSNNIYCNDFKTIENNLLNLMENLFNIDSIKDNFISFFSDLLIHKSKNIKLEEVIFKNLWFYILKLINKSMRLDTVTNNILNVLFVIQYRKIGLNIKNKITQNTLEKEKHLNINSLHFLMTSISHIQNNTLSKISIKNNRIDKLIGLLNDGNIKDKQDKINKLLNMINKLDSPFDDYISFINKVSSLFCNFMYDTNIKHVDFLYFLLDLVFTNGINIRYPNINIKINIDKDIVNKNININIYDSYIISSVYAILENAIESNSNNINININRIGDNINIDIQNDGEVIEDEYIIKNMFKAHYGNKGQYGLGLYISKKQLEEIGYKVLFIDNIFRIEIPIYSFKH